MKSIELFAGAGGLALGLEKAGFEHIGLIEFDESAAKTLKKNRPNWNVLCEDVENVASRDLESEFSLKKGELDLLSGGAPCQSFSYAGKRLGLEDIRGTMFYHYATFLKKLQPKMFLFENVKGLLTHDSGKTYSTICDIFEQEGYLVEHALMNAWDYGVPQKRERLITIGIRKDLSSDFIYKVPIKYNFKLLMKDVKLDVNPPKNECERYSEYKASVFKLVPPGGYWRDIEENIAKEYMKSCWYMGGGRTGILRRIGLDEPCLTVLTSPGMKQTDRCHPIEVRPFSYRENARIQTFPDDWTFEGTLTEKYRQVGNAVPVNLAKEIGLQIIKTLQRLESKNMEDKYTLSFIKQEDFENHVANTIKSYDDTLNSINLAKFNSNIIDPIKLTFDKALFKKTWEEIIALEIHRQRDKSNSNSIGYFHQNMFKYINNCVVPKEGFDIIYTKPDGKKIYVEMKNKHNTMNSSSAQKTYMKMQAHILNHSEDECYLVEAIAQYSKNVAWAVSLDKIHMENPKIRRVSIDEFYKIVTGVDDAFFQICMQLPITIEKLISRKEVKTVEPDTVVKELRAKDPNLLKALYLLAFESYLGFDKI